MSTGKRKPPRKELKRRIAELERENARLLQASKAAEERYRQFIENLPLVAYTEIPREGGHSTLEYVSPQVERFYGYSVEDYLKPGVQQSLIHADDREWVLKAHEEAYAGGQDHWSFEYRNLDPEGRLFWTRDEAVMIRDDAGVPVRVLGFTLDITDRKLAEAELQEAQERYRQLLENMPVSMYLEVPGKGGLSYPQYVSPQTERIFGHPLERWSEPGFQESLIHPDDREAVLARYAEAYGRADERFTFEYRVVHADGRTIWVRDEGIGISGEDGELRLIQGFMQDITDRVLAETELKDANERYRALAENMPGMLYMEVPIEAGIAEVSYVSPQVERLYGYPVERYMQTGFQEAAIHPDDRDWVIQRYEELYASDLPHWELEYRFVHADGRTMWIRDHAVAMRDEEGALRYVLGFTMDVTDRVLAERELREATGRYRLLVENLPISMYIDTPDLTGTTTTTTYVSPQVERLYGYPADAWLEQGFFENVLLHPGDRGWVLREYDEIYARRDERWELEFRIVKADGSTAWLRDVGTMVSNDDGTIAHVQGFGQDVTARVLAEAEIRRQKQYFESLVEISPVAVVTMGPDEIVSGWNPAAARLFGYTSEEAIGRHIDVLVVPEELAPEGEAIVKEATERGRAHRLSRRRTKDGRAVEVEIDIVPLIVDGEHQGYYAIYHDVTELQEARRAADSANEAKSAFLATMSHEIRTPMNAIIGMGGLLLGTELDAEQREYASTIANSGESLLSIINDILDFSKIEAGKMELENAPFDARACVESVVDLIGPVALRKGLEVAYEIEPGTPETAVADASRLRQILLNLLNNAVKFTEHGEIAVWVGSSPTTVPGTIGYHVTVRDTGIGIPPDRTHRLFGSFSQADVSTSRRYGGTGLGLAISKRLAELMDGTMWVESSGVPGEGSTFHLTFVAGSTEMMPTALRRDGAFRGRRALVVDDNATNRRLLTALLGAWGIRSVTADGAEEALEALGDGGFDLAVLDMVMPGADGLDLATRIHEMVPELPVVLASSLGRRDVASDPRWDAAGVRTVVTKPVKASSLHGAVATVLGASLDERTEEGGATLLDAELGSKHPLRILVAEDNVVNQKLALRLLDKLGYRADIAANGLEVLEALERQPYDLLLSDVQMPEMDGLEATRRIIQRWPEGERPWIVAMTAEAMQGDRERCLEAGMNDYVTKPIRVEELVAAIERTPGRAAARSAPSRDPVVASVDAAVLQHLIESTGGDEGFVAEIIDGFLADGPGLVAAAGAGLESGDAAEVRRPAHTLKSNAATFGAHELAERSRRLEEAAVDGALDGAEALLAAVAEELERVREGLRRERARLAL